MLAHTTRDTHTATSAPAAQRWAVLCASVIGIATAADAQAAERHAREVAQVKCSKGQYRFDPRLYRCLEVTVYETWNGKRVPRVYHLWEKRRGKL